MADQTWQEWFEEAWAIREDTLYRALFGDTGPGIYPLDFQLFNTVFRQESVDPRWLHEGVFECPPSGTRQQWLYVSSGLSNAWDADSPTPDQRSGLGCEFLFECPQQSRWAVVFLQKMIAFQILLAAGRFPGKPLLQIWDRIPLRAPIDGSSSVLSWALIAPSPNFGGAQQLPSGRFEFMQFIGITEDEAEYARQRGSDHLLPLLQQRNAAPVTDPTRRTVLSEPAN
jgi:hypothetical protein